MLERDSHLMLSEGTIYPILNRLRVEGLVQSQWVEAEAGHPRKYYELTQNGRDRATHMAETWTKFSAGLGFLIEPVLKDKEVEAPMPKTNRPPAITSKRGLKAVSMEPARQMQPKRSRARRTPRRSIRIPPISTVAMGAME